MISESDWDARRASPFVYNNTVQPYSHSSDDNYNHLPRPDRFILPGGWRYVGAGEPMQFGDRLVKGSGKGCTWLGDHWHGKPSPGEGSVLRIYGAWKGLVRFLTTEIAASGHYQNDWRLCYIERDVRPASGKSRGCYVTIWLL